MVDKQIESLPTVNEALQSSYTNYTYIANQILDYKTFCKMGAMESYNKVQEWCVHLNCINASDPCTSLTKSQFFNNKGISEIMSNTSKPIFKMAFDAQSTNESINPLFYFMVSIGYNGSNCYDDYICDLPKNSAVAYWILGITCFTLCLCGILGNLVLLPAYNFGLNRSGTTSYLTAMALFDCFYLLLTLIIYVSHYLPQTFIDQMIAYGQFSAYLVPIALPIMQFCDLVVLWLTVALLIDRLMHLNVGTHVKILFSHYESIKIILAVILLCLAYIGCKFFEYKNIYYSYVDDTNFNRTLVRVVLTQIGQTEMFQNLFYHWLKVPIEMFLPYLGCGMLISMVVQKMVNLNTSKWKAVASLCNDTACACVCRTGVCGTECREGVRTKTDSIVEVREFDSSCATDQQPQSRQVQDSANANNLRIIDPIEKELAYLFFQLPKIDETRENANVITAVCIGLILLLCKVPKILLHVILTENYIRHDPQLFKLINQFLDTIYASLKPIVCILVGAHFREALLSPRQYYLKSQLESQTTNNNSNQNLILTQMQNKIPSMSLCVTKEDDEQSPFIPLVELNTHVVHHEDANEQHDTIPLDLPPKSS